MRSFFRVRLPLLVFASSMMLAQAANWPGFRNDGHGISSEQKAPVKWSKTENVRWRTPLPEPGNSSPIVWDRKVFVTQAVGDKRTVMCFDKQTGKLLWQEGVTYSEKEQSHESNPQCSATPVTDGERVVATFGSAGVHSYDLGGKRQWSRDLGKQTHIWGYGSSPIIRGDLCILYFGPGPRSFLMALDKKSGKTVWQVDVPEINPPERFDGFAGKSGGEKGTWSTPLIVKTPKREEVVMSFMNDMRGFDPKTGRELWKTDGLNPLIYTSVMAGENTIVGTGGFFGSSVAVKAGGSGDLSKEKIWFHQREKRHRIGTGVIRNGYIYLCDTIGFAECINLATGETVWDERLAASSSNGEIWGSMIAVGENLYAVNQSGDTFVLRANPQKFEQISRNSVNERSNSTLAASDGEIFLRTHAALWCISDKKSE
jgi:outer membrane protein assembly factor BamB